MTTIRPIQPSDDAKLQQIIQKSLIAYDLALPGTAYDDPELGHLSSYYDKSEDRQYFTALDSRNEVLGGAGIAEYDRDVGVAELQKVYLSEKARGQGLGYQLLDQVVQFAQAAGYQTLYLETHHRLGAAINLYEKYGFCSYADKMDRFYASSTV